MAYVKIRPRRSTKAEWQYANPILAEGEIGFEVPDAGSGKGLVNIKQGDGVTAWNDLPYALDQAVIKELIDLNIGELIPALQETITGMQATIAIMQEDIRELKESGGGSLASSTAYMGDTYLGSDNGYVTE